MKKFLNSVTKTVSEHRWLAVVIVAAVIAVLAILIAVLNMSGGNGETGYFTDGDYPVYVKTTKNGNLQIRIDSKESTDLTWAAEVNPSEVVTVTEKKNSEGKLTSEIKPEMGGYSTITYSLSDEMYGMPYMAAEVIANVMIAVDPDGVPSITLSDISETTSNAGATDSESPYLIEDDRIYFPNGGEWSVEGINVMGSDAEWIDTPYYMYRGISDDGWPYFAIGVSSQQYFEEGASPTEEEITRLMSTEFVLKNEELGIEQKLVGMFGGNGRVVLSKGDTEK